MGRNPDPKDKPPYLAALLTPVELNISDKASPRFLMASSRLFSGFIRGSVVYLWFVFACFVLASLSLHMAKIVIMEAEKITAVPAQAIQIFRIFRVSLSASSS